MRRAWSAAALAVFSACSIAPALAQQTCHLEPLAEVPMHVSSENAPVIRVAIEGNDAQLLIDTGAPVSLIAGSFVSGNKLQTQVSRSPAQMGTGENLYNVALVNELKIGQLTANQTVFYIAPPSVLPDYVVGTIGADLLGRWDAEFDFGNGTLGLYAHNNCGGKSVHWTRDKFFELPFSLTKDHHVQVPVMLDGKKVNAIIDTGASISAIGGDKAEALFGIAQDQGVLDELGSHRAKAHVFKSLDLHGYTINNAVVAIVPDLRIPDGDMLIGMTVLGELHVYLAYGDKKLFITPANAR